jgi:uncharacterized repeat protein (TIGR03803 family)
MQAVRPGLDLFWTVCARAKSIDEVSNILVLLRSDGGEFQRPGEFTVDTARAGDYSIILFVKRMRGGIVCSVNCLPHHIRNTDADVVWTLKRPTHGLLGYLKHRVPSNRDREWPGVAAVIVRSELVEPYAIQNATGVDVPKRNCARSGAKISGLADGNHPRNQNVLARVQKGATTPTGGVNNVGIVFKITPSGSQTILHQFDTTHGSTPNGGLVLGNDGNFYGTTQLGGAHSYGNIFKITPSGVLTVLYDFTGNADGGYPVAPLVFATDGNFYGTSYPGVAFKFSASGTFTIINKIPTVSYGPLLQARDGNFYGVTEFAGTFSAGTIYKIVGSTVTTLYNFDGTHGSFLIGGLVQGADGNLYGTTTAGGTTNAGVIFRITTAGALSVLVDFDGVHTLNGYQAFAGLVAGSDGNLYGATIWGGTSGYGEIFQMTIGGAYAALYNFVAPS